MLDLMKFLTEEDRELIKQYMIHYSEAGYHYVGNDYFLREWAKNKKVLFGLLGGQLSREIDLEYEEDPYIISQEILALLEEDSFGKSLREILSAEALPALKKCVIEDPRNSNSNSYFPTYIDFRWGLTNVFNKMGESFKFKFRDAKKTLQINKEESPIKALGKFVKYIYENNESIRINYPSLLLEYESFRQKHSLILNEKRIKGKLVFSIHPLDFLTMSNNDSGWDSCMKWGKVSKEESGCYHAGTIEMMNSNNVICCFIKSKKPYVFYNNEEKGVHYEWNNKKWRSLAIVTKDIIVSGKSYPYKNKKITITILKELNKMANENKDWHYKYGIEPYRDMIRINSNSCMDSHRNWIENNQTYGHKRIIFDTKGMYNDYLNDHDTDYYCYRNTVNHTKIISYSGKALCSCCGEEFLEEYDYCGNEYNDRYEHTGNDICEKCLSKIGRCEDCQRINNDEDMPFITVDQKVMCFDCFKKNYHFCPDCGELYRQRGRMLEYGSSTLLFRKIIPKKEATSLSEEELKKENNLIRLKNKEIENTIKNNIENKKEFFSSWNLVDYFYKYNACSNCIDNIIKNKTYGKVKKISIRFHSDVNCYYSEMELSEEEKNRHSEEALWEKESTLEDFLKYKELNNKNKRGKKWKIELLKEMF